MEHECVKCDFFTMNNKPKMTCPECGSRCISTFDEPPEIEDYDEPYEQK